MPEVPGVEHRIADVNGFRMHIAESGSGEPLVLLHGWPQHWYEWRDLIGPLAKSRRVICPDLRGFGWSEAPGHGYDPKTFAADLVALLDAEDLDSVDFIGHDWGGFTGFLIGLDHPERLRRLIALNILPPFTPPARRGYLGAWRFWYQWALALPLAGRLATRSLGWRFHPIAGYVGGGERAWSTEVRRAFGSQFADSARARATTSLYRNAQRVIWEVARGKYRDSHLTVPTRLIFGTGDRVLDYRLLEGIERFGDDLEVELVEGVGHFLADERPELVVERARSFLGS